jgi:excisionase family DNA binding protein
LGVDAKVVARWVEEGWLSATRSSDAPNTPHRIARSDVHRFLNSPPAAYAVAPDKIRDARFRRTWQRARHPLYLAVGEAAEKLGVPVATLSRLARLGRVPAVRWGNWLIREDHLDDVRKALHASSRKKPQSLRRLTVAERRLLVAGTALGFNSREMGERMGRAMGSLTGVLTQMAASGESGWTPSAAGGRRPGSRCGKGQRPCAWASCGRLPWTKQGRCAALPLPLPKRNGITGRQMRLDRQKVALGLNTDELALDFG